MLLKKFRMPVAVGGVRSHHNSLKSAVKRGFTIMELVIVIAVIAVLAAVLIPTFANITERANESNDIQAVRNMNTALAADSVDGAPEDIGEVYAILSSSGYNGEGLIPLGSGREFAWMKSQNKIVLVDTAEKSVVYPEELSGVTYNDGNVDDFIFLNKNNTSIGSGSAESPYTVSSAAGFNVLLQKMQTEQQENGMFGSETSVTYIQLAEDIDLSGVALPSSYDEAVYAANIHLDGGGHKISGAEGYSALGISDYYGLNNTIENVTFSGCSVSYSLLGYGVYSNAATDKVVVNGVTAENCSTYGGAFLYYTGGGQIEFKNCTVNEDTVISSGTSQMATGGFVGNGQGIVIDGCTMSGTVMGANGSNVSGFVGQGTWSDDTKIINSTMNGSLKQYSADKSVYILSSGTPEITGTTYSGAKVVLATSDGSENSSIIKLTDNNSDIGTVSTEYQKPVLNADTFKIENGKLVLQSEISADVASIEIIHNVRYDYKPVSGGVLPNYDRNMDTVTLEKASLAVGNEIYTFVSKVMQVVGTGDTENRTVCTTTENADKAGTIDNGVYYFDARTNADTSYNFLRVDDGKIVTTFSVVAYDGNGFAIGNYTVTIYYNENGMVVG